MTSETARRHDVPSPPDHRWPGLDRPPTSRVRSKIAHALVARAVRMVNLQIVLPSGRIIGSDSSTAPVMRIHDEDAFFARLGVHGKIGFGEAYMAGDWTTDDLPGVLTALAARLTTLVPQQLQALRRWYDPRHPDAEENTLDGARANIHRHYDLSNELFALFLDESMTYSSAWFEPGDSLTDAQVRKLDGILDMARVGSQSHLLEIGTGWGSLAIRAAGQRGARVTTITISEEQKALAERRIAAAGLDERIQVLIRDYREARGQYDAVVSVEMIEAVGERYWPDYFRVVDRLLKPGGRVGLQTITMPHDRLLASRESYTWIHKYIFPGGLLPSIPAIEQTLARHTGLRVVERRDLGMDYAVTLRQWRERFLARRDDVLALGFDDTFIRMWAFYLAYCEAGFRVLYLSNSQLGLARDH